MLGLRSNRAHLVFLYTLLVSNTSEYQALNQYGKKQINCDPRYVSKSKFLTIIVKNQNGICAAGHFYL